MIKKTVVIGSEEFKRAVLDVIKQTKEIIDNRHIKRRSDDVLIIYKF